MQEKRASMTAVLTAFARAYHATHDEPKIFDDSLAWSLFTEEERAYFGSNLAQAPSSSTRNWRPYAQTRRRPWHG